jgi:hypothetical protein
MGNAGLPTLELSLWRPGRFSRAVILHADGADSEGASGTPLHDRLYEQIYSWKLREDIWGVVVDSTRAELLLRLIDPFRFSIDPRSRTLAKLVECTSYIRELLVSGEGRAWLASMDFGEGDFADTFALQIPPLVSLLQQLEWVCETFCEVPGVTVMVR